MSKCKDIQKELEAFLRSETDSVKKVEIQDHLKECQKCSQVLKESIRLSEILQAWKVTEPPPHLYENLKTKINGSEAQERRQAPGDFTGNGLAEC